METQLKSRPLAKRASVAQFARADKIGDLSEILYEGAQARWLPRGELPELTGYFDDPLVHRALGRGLQFTCSAAARPDLRSLPAAPGREAAVADVEHLIEILATLLDPPALGVRLEVLDRAMCPRFHVDRVGVRLLCTYRGPGTELLDEASADRRWLGAAGHGLDDELSGLVRDPGVIQRIPRQAVLLMKGAGWPGNEHLGAIHRSPQVNVCDGPRIVIAIDALWS